MKIDREVLAQDVAIYPDAYQFKRAQRLGVSARGIGDALKRQGLTYKKTLRHPKKPRLKREKLSR